MTTTLYHHQNTVDSRPLHSSSFTITSLLCVSERMMHILLLCHLLGFLPWIRSCVVPKTTSTAAWRASCIGVPTGMCLTYPNRDSLLSPTIARCTYIWQLRLLATSELRTLHLSTKPHYMHLQLTTTGYSLSTWWCAVCCSQRGELCQSHWALDGRKSPQTQTRENGVMAMTNYLQEIYSQGSRS